MEIQTHSLAASTLLPVPNGAQSSGANSLSEERWKTSAASQVAKSNTLNANGFYILKRKESFFKSEYKN